MRCAPAAVDVGRLWRRRDSLLQLHLSDGSALNRHVVFYGCKDVIHRLVESADADLDVTQPNTAIEPTIPSHASTPYFTSIIPQRKCEHFAVSE